MATRDIYEERVHAQIEALYNSMEHHEAHLESTESTSMDSHLKALRELKEKREHVDSLLQALKESGEHGWEQIRHGIDAAIDEFKHAMDVAREKLHSEK